MKSIAMLALRNVARWIIGDEVAAELRHHRARIAELEKRIDVLSVELGKFPLVRRSSVWS